MTLKCTSLKGFRQFSSWKIFIVNYCIRAFKKSPSLIAWYLQLPNANKSKGHSIKRHSASLLVESKEDILSYVKLKIYGGCKFKYATEGSIS